MPEPFKNLFSEALIKETGAEIARVYPGFERARFEAMALRNLKSLELKERSSQIATALGETLPASFRASAEVLSKALGPELHSENDSAKGPGLTGWAIMPLAEYVAAKGLGHFDLSLRLLREMTMRGSSEFEVRPFFRDHAEITLNAARIWARDPNLHVRRLASEGSRPRLPWGIRLHDFVRDPAPILPILETLRDDPHEYVRRSVANNLNDIAKDHPDLVADIARRWLQDASRDRARLVKHACRTLIKQGHAGALAAFGFGPPDLARCAVSTDRTTVRLGDTLGVLLELTAGRTRQKLLVDYVLHFLRANGRLSAKVFKWQELTLDAGETRTLHKAHPYRKVTTRKDYAGQQAVSVQINGVTMGKVAFELTL